MSEQPTTLPTRVAATDPAPSRQGPPAYRPGRPEWDAGWASCQAQAARMAWVVISGWSLAAADELEATILTMRPKPPTMEGTP